MKTFLDTHKDWSSTFLLYGNTNDSVWCADLTVRSSEQYLVRLLRSRGYKHVIFYGEAGTKGAYCLDPESARFFFGDNEGIPLRGRHQADEVVPDAEYEEVGQEGQPAQEPAAVEPATAAADQPAQPAAARDAQATSVAQAMFSHRRSRTRRTEATVEVAPEQGTQASVDSPASEPAPQGTDAAQAPEPSRGRRASRPTVVRYARREMDLAHFVMLIQPLMCQKSSRMVVVFYNIFTSDFGTVAPLRDNILNVWEQARSNGQMDNLCLIMAPETMHSTKDLISRVRDLGLAPKFLVEDHDGGDKLNPLTCVAMGLPREDEVRNLLRRLALVGTSDTGRRIAFDYLQMDDIVTEIIYCSRSCDSRDSETAVFTTSEYMTQICGRVEDYVDAQEGTEAVEVTPDVVDAMWGIPSRDRESALERLNRPGWEAVYRAVKSAVENALAYQARMQRRQAQATPGHEPADWVVERLATTQARSVPRPPVPHFVLLGNPGTGKSTVARLIGDVLREYGILKVGSTVEVTRNNLTSSYIAGVPKATMACVERAEEGVLFIDEAHALGRKDGGANHEGTGKEVLSELVHAMTDPGHRFCLVMAGYPDEMREMLKGDDGLMRRIGSSNVVLIEDYGPELLEQILVSFIEENDCRLDPALVSTQTFDDVEARPLSCFVTRVYQERDRKRFGNAGDMETIGLRACALARGGVVTEECFYQGAVDHTWFVPSDVGNSLDHILSDIRERFVGMEGVEQYFVDKAEEVREQLAHGGSEDGVYLRPIVLRGEPGTGKTEVATMLGRLYHHLHLLGTPEPIIISGSTLASSLQGGSQQKVLEYVREAQERKALLFVDEAHQLVSNSFDGQGALKAFLNPLTDKAHPFMCVFAVYPSMYQAFCRLDPGSASRFQVLDLPSYTGPELHAILHKMMERHAPKLTCTPEADQALRLVCAHIYDTRTEETGNGRRMERLLEDMNVLRRRRCRAAGLPDDAAERLVFQLADIPRDLLATISE